MAEWRIPLLKPSHPMKLFSGRTKILEEAKAKCAYIAGLVDGEGAIEIDKRNDPRIRIGMKSLLPYELGKQYGGCVTKYWQSTSLIYTWNIYNTEKREWLTEFIWSIIPEIRMKAPQLKLLLEAIELKEKRPENWKQRMKEIKEEIRRLNNANPPDLSEIPHWTLKRRNK